MADGSPEAVPNGKAGEAPLFRFAQNPSNPRDAEEYDPDVDGDFADFGGTVKKFGVLQPIAVCPVNVWLEHHPQDRDAIGPDVWWVIVIGNRRFAAARAKGIESLTFVRNDDLGGFLQAKKTSLIENHHRKNVNPVREAIEIRDILEAAGGSYRDLATELGFSHGLVYQRLQLLKLIPGLQNLVATNQLPAHKAVGLAKLSPDDQQRLLDLGSPYSAARLRSNDDSAPADGLVTRSLVKIPKASPPAKVVDVLVEGLPPELVAEVARLLSEKLANAPAEQN